MSGPGVYPREEDQVRVCIFCGDKVIVGAMETTTKGCLERCPNRPELIHDSNRIRGEVECVNGHTFFVAFRPVCEGCGWQAGPP